MKPNNNKKILPSKGFGFADAMFGIKNIAMQYEDLQQHPMHMQPPKIQEKPNNTIKVLKKEPIVQKKAPPPTNNTNIRMGNDQNEKQTFKLSAGKEFQNFSIHVLIPICTNPNIFELTLDGVESQWEYNIFCDGVAAHMIVPSPEVSFNFNAIDVNQGGLGNCYFIATLASLAHLPETLKARIPKYKSYSGKDKTFEVNLFESGKNIKIVVDNLFPKIFVKPVFNDISLMILQKAYAQAYGNFDITNVGYSSDSLRDMTGAPSQYIDIKDKAKLTEDLKQVFEQSYPIIIASKANVKLPLITPKHSFNVLDFKTQKNNIYLKLRDPRGKNCSQLPAFFHLDPEESSNGIFWVDYKILVDNFEVITISKVKKGSKYFYKTFSYKQLTNNEAAIIMKVKEKGVYTFSCHQKHHKFFDEKHCYKMIRILLAQIEVEKGRIYPISTIDSDFKVQQTCTINAELGPGTYILLGKYGKGSQKAKMQNEVMTFSIYSSILKTEQMQFSVLRGNIPAKDFIMKYIEKNKEKFKESVSNNKLCRYFGPFYGYLCLYYENGQKSVVQQLEYITQNIVIGEKKVSLGPNETKLLVHQIGQQNNCSHKFAFKSNTIYK